MRRGTCGALVVSACARFSAAEPPLEAGSDASVVPEGGSRDSSGAASPPRFVQSASNSILNETKTLTVTLPRPVEAHSAILVAVGATQDPPKVSDDTGDAFTIRAAVTVEGQSFHVLLAEDVAGGAIRVSFEYPNTSRFIEAYVHEYADVGAHALVDATYGAPKCDRSPDCMKSPPILAPARSLLFGFAVGGRISAGTGFQTRETLNDNLTEDRVVLEEGMVQAIATKKDDYPVELVFGAVLRGR